MTVRLGPRNIGFKRLAIGAPDEQDDGGRRASRGREVTLRVRPIELTLSTVYPMPRVSRESGLSFFVSERWSDRGADQTSR